MNKIHAPLLLLSLIAIGLSNCTIANIESNKSPDFTKKVSRIYLTAKGYASSTYLESMSGHLLNGLKSHGVEGDVYYFNPLSLEKEADVIAEKVKSYRPDVVMSIEQTERRLTSDTSGGSNESGATLDLKLFVPGRENPVWRAFLHVDGSFWGDIAAKDTAKKIVKKLIADGVIE